MSESDAMNMEPNRLGEVAEKMEDMGQEELQSLWVFGYGSLCWNPGFEFRKSLTGHIKGFARRFWQGNTQHRGTDEKVKKYVVSMIGIFQF